MRTVGAPVHVMLSESIGLVHTYGAGVTSQAVSPVAIPGHVSGTDPAGPVMPPKIHWFTHDALFPPGAQAVLPLLLPSILPQSSVLFMSTSEHDRWKLDWPVRPPGKLIFQSTSFPCEPS